MSGGSEDVAGKAARKAVEKKIEKAAGKAGLDESVVKEAVKALESTEDAASIARETLALIGDGVEVMSKAPPDVRQYLAPAVVSAVTQGGSSSDRLYRIAEKAAEVGVVLKAIYSGLGGGDEATRKLEERVEELTKEFKEWRDALSNAEKEALKESLEELGNRIDELHKKVEEVRKVPVPIQQPKSGLEVLADLKDSVDKELNKVVELLKFLGFKVEKGESLDIDKARKTLEELGFEVRRKGMSEEEYRRRLEEVRRKAYKRALKRLQVEKVKYETVGSILLSAINEVFGPLVRQRLGMPTEEELEKALNQRIKEVAGSGGKQEGGGGSESPAPSES